MVEIGGKRGQAAIESPAATARRMHGQAAMEYLMTYGWALLVIVIVIAILLIINPFAAPQGCRFDQIGFTCTNPVVDSGGKLFMQLTNGNNNAVKISGVVCTSSKGTSPPPNPGGTPQLVGRQQTIEVNTFFTPSPTCANASSMPGAEFTGKLWVFYNNEEDGSGYPVRTASANVVTKVVRA